MNFMNMNGRDYYLLRNDIHYRIDKDSIKKVCGRGRLIDAYKH